MVHITRLVCCFAMSIINCSPTEAAFHYILYCLKHLKYVYPPKTQQETCIFHINVWGEKTCLKMIYLYNMCTVVAIRTPLIINRFFISLIPMICRWSMQCNEMLTYRFPFRQYNNNRKVIEWIKTTKKAKGIKHRIYI